MQELGFIGLGIMGSAMAANLIKAGFDVTVWNRSPEKALPLAALGAGTYTLAVSYLMTLRGAGRSLGSQSPTGAREEVAGDQAQQHVGGRVADHPRQGLGRGERPEHRTLLTHRGDPREHAAAPRS